MLAHEYARGARVVEVDVREEEMANVAEREPALLEPRLQRRDARGGAAVEQRRPVVRPQEVRADHTRGAEVVEVERMERRHAAPSYEGRQAVAGRSRRRSTAAVAGARSSSAA